jgi:hypothetical protein
MSDELTTPWSIPFWEASKQGELRLPWCTSCGSPHFPPRLFCPVCWGDHIEWRRSEGRGTIYSFTVVRANPPTPFRSRVPFGIAIVRLDDGVQLMTSVESDLDLLECDAPVRVGFREVDGEILLAASVLRVE